jgi:tRNA 2-selenouridine synthase
MTGSGKTDILQILENKGYQILDLEKIARHKGSVFGSLGEDPQKSNEQFENDLFTDLFALDSTKTIWIEDESRNIGYNVIPPEFFKTMSRSPVIVLNIEKKFRLNNLVGKYGKFQDEDLIYCLNKISKRLGGLNTKKAIHALIEGKPELTARIVLEYYDKFYHYSLSRKQQKKVFHINSTSINPERNVQIITSFAINNKLCTLPYRPV